MCKHDGCTLSLADQRDKVSSQAKVPVMATADDSEVVARPEPDRSKAKSLVFDALTAVIPGLKADAVDERQELYADLGMDSLRFVQLLVELEEGSTST